MKFDKNKILTCVTADQSKVGDVGWAADTLTGIRAMIEKGGVPKEIVGVLPDDYTHRFKTDISAYSLFYLAPYEFLQEQWVKENKLEAGDKVAIISNWEAGDKGYKYIQSRPVGSVLHVAKIDCDVITAIPDTTLDAVPAFLPYFAIEIVKEPIYAEYHVPEKVNEPEYRPFASAEEYKPHRGEWLQDRRSGCVYLPTGYNEGEVKMGAEWVWYSYLFEHCVFADTGEPAGVKL